MKRKTGGGGGLLMFIQDINCQIQKHKSFWNGNLNPDNVTRRYQKFFFFFNFRTFYGLLFKFNLKINDLVQNFVGIVFC